jgi:SAM-dependent methyltransferase
MNDPARDFFDIHPDPSPSTTPIGAGQLERMDENLHLGWAWHRHRWVYRAVERPRILDAGCGTGLTSLALARLNPGAKVLGLDCSGASLELAQARAAAEPALDVAFRQHDLGVPLPDGDGPFDFIVCRNVLPGTDRPDEVLKHLAAKMAPDGLLLVVFPAQGPLHVRRQVKRVVATLAADAPLADQAMVARDLFRALRPDHPWRQVEGALSGPDGPDVERIITGYLAGPTTEWDIEDGLAAIEAGGLKFLYNAGVRPWQPSSIFGGDLADGLRLRVEGLDDGKRSVLMDALDPGLSLLEHRLYACRPEHEPVPPGWPDHPDPATVARLVPHATGLITRVAGQPDAGPGRPTQYRMVTGAVGALDSWTDALLQLVDGKATCGAIDREARARLGLEEEASSRRDRWMHMASRGFVLMEPDLRERVPCQHLGPVRDRLDCACPRAWLRACERHVYCSLGAVEGNDPRRAAYDRALSGLGVESAAVCGRCPDYIAEDVNAVG